MGSIIIDSRHWEVFFENLPDWVVPLIKLTPRFYTSDQYQDNWDSYYFYYSFNYIWEKVDNYNYRLLIQISGILENENLDELPLYVDLSAWIINTNFRNSIQHQLGY